MFRKFTIGILLLGLAHGLLAQESLKSEQSVSRRQLDNREMPINEQRSRASEFARLNNLPERISYSDGTILEIRRITPAGQPVYYKTFNLNAAKTISTNKVWRGGTAGLNLDGSGIVVGIWDGGIVRASHVEFGGRAIVMDGASSKVDHATHVAGTVGAAGVRNDAHGMAHRSTLESYDWNNDLQEMEAAAEQGLLISNHSYGYNSGWDYNPDDDRWSWWGWEGFSENEDYSFGFYWDEDSLRDEITYRNPYYLIVTSAGNDRGDGPSPGTPHDVWTGSSWEESTTTRAKDGGEDGFDCVPWGAVAKNTLAVGAILDIPGGYTDTSDVELIHYSVFGPTDDGRIKPDLVANGLTLLSSTAASDQSYSAYSGTSMSAPSVSGSLALLQQNFHDLHGKYMLSSQVRALVLHTADEAGNPGPDYMHGWGVMNTRKAAELITELPGEQLFSDTLNNLEAKDYLLFSNGQEEVRITMAWTDPPGMVPAYQLNPTDTMLVNDLDITLVRESDKAVFRPFVLDPSNPSKMAQTGDNQLDNIEQIVIKIPEEGLYTLHVSHKDSLVHGVQAFSVVVTGLKYEYVASGRIELNEANGTVLLTSADRYLNNMEVEWLIETNNDLPVSFYFDFLETEADRDILTIYDGIDTTSPVLAVFSGSLEAADTMLISSSDQMFITFSSDEQVTAKGFLARYCTLAPEGSYLIGGENYPCANTTEAYAAVGQEGAYFMWDSDKDWEISQKSVEGIHVAVGDSEGLLSVSPYNRCGTGIESMLSIQTLPRAPMLEYMNGDTIPCLGDTSLMTTNSMAGVLYQWELPDSWEGSSTSDSLFYVPRGESGKIYLTAYNACGQGNVLSRSIQVHDVPVSHSIATVKDPPCALTTQNFYVNALPDHQYVWRVQDDWQISGSDTGDTVSVVIGEEISYLHLTSINHCGETADKRFYLTSPIPPDAKLLKYEGQYAYPELEISNMNEFKSVQWYRNGEALSGTSGALNKLVVNLNGMYTVETISDDGCVNPGSDVSGMLVEQNELAFLVYRSGESAIIIHNTTSEPASYSIVSIGGQLVGNGLAQPGVNELSFRANGVFLVRITGQGIDQKYKVLF